MAVLTQKNLQQWKEHQFDKQGGTCVLCGLPLDSWQKANADHNHHTGHIHGLLHGLGNSVLEGKVAGLMYRSGLKGKADFPTVLRNLADYWDQDYSAEPVHPYFILDESKKFARLTREGMIKELRGVDVDVDVDVDKTYSKETLIDIFKKVYRAPFNNKLAHMFTARIAFSREKRSKNSISKYEPQGIPPQAQHD